MRKDLSDLVATARKAGLYTHLITAGVTASLDRLRELRNAGLDAIQISFQDTRQATNDWLAGTRSFDQKRDVFVAAKQVGLAVTLNIVVHRHNLDHICEMIALAEEWQADRLELAHVQYTGWAFLNRAALLPTRRQVECAMETVEQARATKTSPLQIVHVLPDYFQEFPKACMSGWGRVYITINPDGTILPCQTARCIPDIEFPNVAITSLHDAWHDSSAFQRFRGTDWMPEPCQSCDRRYDDFGGCRCQAFLLAGNAEVTDPVCSLSPRHHLVMEALKQAEQVDTELQFRRFSG